MFLALDTSQNSGSIALYADHALVYSAFFNISITHSETLMPQIDAALSFCGYSRIDLEAIVLCKGPGSFTGLRIGMATAKGISLGLQIPIYTYNSLESTALSLYGCGRNILAVVDAKMKEIYFAKYDEFLNELVSPRVLEPLDILQMEPQDCFVIGTAAPAISEILSAHQIPHRVALPHQNLLHAEALFTLMEIKGQPMAYDFNSLAELEPEYLRESTAQVLRKKHQ
ncbi:MAG: tRNA (adenosine(37)-N6)-threonylcarbamoyltransferase complex dimerization subunit type 1 TsaB [Candidatus Cloacimonetes bacterium HGW-Cloacimonetes-1]|jgi:tRNA threonylcarbamoyladenosine biosynthesis protein TsaB|nr:MAG: tRNA (adenosine(37)-N6)-threonylcarbamoyltransferase complex dimerization subunit type 1 TsaB [Candidatus Cloacimonetes bacterium HGW-Cloacimonetes-1]